MSTITAVDTRDIIALENQIEGNDLLLNPGQPFESVLDLNGDRSFDFDVELEAGRFYQLTLQTPHFHFGAVNADEFVFSLENANHQFVFEERLARGEDPDPRYVRSTTHDADIKTIVFSVDENGIYDLNLRLAVNPFIFVLNGPAGFIDRDVTPFEVTLSEINVVDENSAPQSIEIDDPLIGSFEYAGDRDQISVQLKAGQSYWIDAGIVGEQADRVDDITIFSVTDASGQIAPHVNLEFGPSRILVEPHTTGPYIIEVGSANAGDYRLTIAEHEETPTADSPENALTLGVGEVIELDLVDRISGNHETVSRWVEVQLEAGEVYWLTGFDQLAQAPLFSDRQLNTIQFNGVYNENGEAVEIINPVFNEASSTYAITLAPIDFIVETTGTYFFDLGPETDGGIFEIGLEKINFDQDLPSGINTSAVITIGGEAQSRIETPSDIDWFAVDVNAGQSYQFSIEAIVGHGWFNDIYFTGLYDSNGDLIDGYDRPRTVSRNTHEDTLTFVPETDGRYYVGVSSGFDGGGDYNIRLDEIDDFNDISEGPSTTTFIGVGETLSSAIETPGDIDWISVELEAGFTYEFQQNGLSSFDGSLQFPVLSGIINDQGNPVFEAQKIGDVFVNNAGIDFNSLATVNITKSGTYYIVAQAEPNYTGTYELQVRNLGTFEDTPDSAQDQKPLEAGEIWQESLTNANDIDWIALDTIADERYRITLESESSGLDASARFKISGIIDENGTELDATITDNGPFLLVDFTAPDDGPYYAVVENNLEDEQHYRLTFDQISTAFNPIDDNTDPSNITVGQPIEGVIDASGDMDVYAVQLEQGQSYNFKASSGSSSVFDVADPAFLKLTGPDGQQVPNVRDDNSGQGIDAEFLFSAPETGLYEIHVGHGDSENPTGGYTLEVIPIRASEDANYLGTTPFTNLAADEVSSSQDAFINALSVDFRIGADRVDDVTQVHFSFFGQDSILDANMPANIGDFDSPGHALPNPESFLETRPDLQNAFRDVLETVSQQIAIDFHEVTDNAQSAGHIRVGISTELPNNFAGLAGLPLGLGAGDSEIYLNDTLRDSAFTPGGHDYYVLLHELGHALGLVHGDEGPDALPQELQSYDFSALIHSHTDEHPTGFMYLDLKALNHLYGTDGRENDNTFYLFDGDRFYYETIHDLGGFDTIRLTGLTDGASISLTSGGWIDVGSQLSADTNEHSANETVFISPETIIERLYGGAGDDTLTGNDANNILIGAKGDDILSGGNGADILQAGKLDDGNDRLFGEGGDDILFGGVGDDRVSGGAGHDKLFAGSGNDSLFGGSGDDLLYNGDGDDRVNGGTGNDTLWGGGGDDILIGGENEDLFVFGRSNGSDIIEDFDINEDSLNIEAAGFSELEDVLAAATQSDTGVMITYADTVLILEDVNLEDLASANIII